MIAFHWTFNLYLTCVPGSQALSAMGHDADEGGDQDAGDGGEHVGQSHQGPRKAGGQVGLVGEHPGEHAAENTENMPIACGGWVW